MDSRENGGGLEQRKRMGCGGLRSFLVSLQDLSLNKWDTAYEIITRVWTI